MNSEDRKEIAEYIAKAMSKHKKEKSWFGGLNIIYKTLIFLVAFGGTVSSLGVGVEYISNLINHEEIERERAYRKSVDILVKDLAGLIKSVDTIKVQGKERSRFYAVGYRAEIKPDGTIIKQYRDWDKTTHLIYPDPFSSTKRFTDWFITNSDGTKTYTFGK